MSADVEDQEVLIARPHLLPDVETGRTGTETLEIRAVGSRAIAALAVIAALGTELRMEAVVDEGVGVRAGDDVDRAAEAAVAAAGTAAGDELLAAERETSRAAVACFDVNVYFIDEHDYQTYLAGSMLMTRPMEPWFSNFTRPAIFAKIVSSFPMPAFRPGRNRRPRWRTMIVPPDEVAVVRFGAQPLRVRIAAVA